MLPKHIVRNFKKINPYVFPLIDRETIEKIKQSDSDIIIDLFVKHTGLSMEDIRGNSRTRNISYYRRILTHVLMDRCGLNLVETAKVINKDHSTIIYYRDNMPTFLTYPDFKSNYDSFIDYLEKAIK